MNMAVELEEEGKTLDEYIGVLKRRKKQLIIPFSITFAIVLLVALLWPSTYRATATILIEEQEIPRELVASTITSFASQRIQMITQRIMTIKNIMGIVDEFELYSDGEKERMSQTEIAKEFSEDVLLETVDSEIIDPTTGRPVQSTIAFSLSYDHSSPRKAQRATNELVNLYLNENLRTRTEKSSNTSVFLRTELKALSDLLFDLEKQIADFKMDNDGSLPELYQYNLGLLERNERELKDAETEIRLYQERKNELESELGQMSPYAATVLETGERVLSDYDRLKALQSEYSRKSATYSEKHPDLVRLKRSIDELELTLGSGISAEDQAIMLRTEQEKLEALKTKYSEGHPQISNQQRVVDNLKTKTTTAVEVTEEIQPDNPSYVYQASKLKTTLEDLEKLTVKKKDLTILIAELQEKTSRTPMVEKEYLAMQREYKNEQLKFQDLKIKVMHAELAENLEQGRQGERFTLIQPPVLPEEPESPNRPLIVILGFVFSVLVGFATIAIREALDKGVRGERRLTDILGQPPLASVPYIQIEEEMKTEGKAPYYLAGGLAGAIVMGLVMIHYFYKPLDVIWYLIVRKLGIG